MPPVRRLVFLLEREKCALDGKACCFQCRKVVCQRMRVLPLLQGTFCSRPRLLAHPNRFSEIEVFGMVHVERYERLDIIDRAIRSYARPQATSFNRQSRWTRWTKNWGDLHCHHRVQKPIKPTRQWTFTTQRLLLLNHR